jgi:putative phage-type endonuclease
METYLMQQGTDAWHEIRCGKVTASRVADIVAKTKTGHSASRTNYMAQLVCERLTKTQAESFTNAAMEHGITQEPFARAAYEAAQGVMVEEVGFVRHPTIEWAGASPDGLVGGEGEGLVEIKCPNTLTMIETLLSQKVPGKYFAQMQFQMACTGRKWCDYVVFDPRMPAKAQLFVKRVDRDDTYIAEIEAEIVKFLAEVQSQVNQLNQYIESKP